MIELFAFRLLITFCVLTLASIQDIQTRHISDILWRIMLVFGCLYYVIDVYNGEITVIEIFFTGMLIAISYVIYRVYNQQEEWFGGADFKAFICIAIMLPVPFIFGMFPFSYAVIVIAELFAFAWYFPKAMKLPKDEWHKIKFPLIPFLLLGFILTTIIIIFEGTGGT